MNPELIRRYADEDPDLTAEEVAEVEAHVVSRPEVRAQVEFERELRQRIRRVFEHSAHAPGVMRERVRAALAADLAQDRDRVEAAAPTDADPPPASPTRRSWWASPQRANFFYVAATIALIVAAILFGILTPPIDHRRPDDPTVDAAQFVSTEHDRCASDPAHLADKAQWKEFVEAQRNLGNHLQVSVPIIDLDHLGYQFIGAGKCDVPGPVPSGHLSYVRRHGDVPRPMVSIFVVRDVQQYAAAGEMKAFAWYVDPANTSHQVLQMSDGERVYLLVCCDAGDQHSVAAAISRAAQDAVP